MARRSRRNTRTEGASTEATDVLGGNQSEDTQEIAREEEVPTPAPAPAPVVTPPVRVKVALCPEAAAEFTGLVAAWPGGALRLTVLDAFTAKVELEIPVTIGELQRMSRWLQFRWSGEMIDNAAINGSFTLRASKGCFGPGGGRAPFSYVRNV